MCDDSFNIFGSCSTQPEPMGNDSRKESKVGAGIDVDGLKSPEFRG